MTVYVFFLHVVPEVLIGDPVSKPMSFTRVQVYNLNPTVRNFKKARSPMGCDFLKTQKNRRGSKTAPVEKTHPSEPPLEKRGGD